MILFLIIAFYLDGLLSNMFIVSSYLYPLCFLLSLVLIYPSFKKSELSKYYLISLIMGLLYDIVYTNTLFINFIIFFLIAILIKNIYNLVSNNYLSLILISFFVIVIYRTLTYLIKQDETIRKTCEMEISKEAYMGYMRLTEEQKKDAIYKQNFFAKQLRQFAFLRSVTGTIIEGIGKGRVGGILDYAEIGNKIIRLRFNREFMTSLFLNSYPYQPSQSYKNPSVQSPSKQKSKGYWMQKLNTGGKLYIGKNRVAHP